MVRENVEDLYAGIEYMQTPGVAEALKLISVKGCEKIARFAFEYARSEHRTQVTCATKANIMKLSEGTLKRVFEQVAPDYPDIEAWHLIVDNCAHQLVKRPEQFDVLVMTNMNGDILSDLSSALVGGLGFAPSANIGSEVAIFEAVHGSAPKYAGKDVINPTALILSAVLMLRYLGLFEQADAIEHAVLVTLEDGVLTGDVVGYDKGTSTTDYTDAIIGNLGRRSEGWTVREHRPLELPKLSDAIDYVRPESRAVVGMDVFIESPMGPNELGASLMELTHETPLSLKLVSSRGTKVFPPDRRDHGHRGSLPLPVHHQGDPRRPHRRRRAPAARGDQPRAPLDAHREAAGVRRGARLHPGPGRELAPERSQERGGAGTDGSRRPSRLSGVPLVVRDRELSAKILNGGTALPAPPRSRCTPCAPPRAGRAAAPSASSVTDGRSRPRARDPGSAPSPCLP